ncbi:MAG: hypothetical protein QME90_08930 [Thermodesulfobacteriota bacterium]|nr:hypothetical protein [Thermodesulfobacteriota bacterium]
MKRSNAIYIILALVVSFTLVASLGYAQKPYYEGKTITFVVPHDAGGGTDVTARVWSKWLPPHIPGMPTIIVRNMPGGGASVGGNFVYTAPKDGLTLLVGSSNTGIGSLLQTKGVKYSYESMPVVCLIGVAEVMVGWIDNTKSYKDFPKAKNLIYGMEPLPNPSTATWLILKDVTGVKSKDVLAFQGGADRALAWYQKETNLTWLTSPQFSQSAKSDVDKGNAVALMQSGLLNLDGKMVRGSYWPDAPTVGEVWKDLSGKDPSGIEWEAILAMLGYCRTANKPLVFPPGTPEDLVNILREAASKMIADPGYQEAAKKVFAGEPTWGSKEAVGILKFANSFAAKTRPWLQKFMEERGGVKF